MELPTYRKYCLSKPHAIECFPFNQDILVYKVAGKMFTLANILPFARINLKCDPEEALALRHTHPGITPAWHMNKKHWNTIHLADFSDPQIFHWIDHSYQLVVAGLPKKVRSILAHPQKRHTLAPASW